MEAGSGTADKGDTCLPIKYFSADKIESVLTSIRKETTSTANDRFKQQPVWALLRRQAELCSRLEAAAFEAQDLLDEQKKLNQEHQILLSIAYAPPPAVEAAPLRVSQGTAAPDIAVPGRNPSQPVPVLVTPSGVSPRGGTLTAGALLQDRAASHLPSNASGKSRGAAAPSVGGAAPGFQPPAIASASAVSLHETSSLLLFGTGHATGQHHTASSPAPPAAFLASSAVSPSMTFSSLGVVPPSPLSPYSATAAMQPPSAGHHRRSSSGGVGRATPLNSPALVIADPAAVDDTTALFFPSTPLSAAAAPPTPLSPLGDPAVGPSTCGGVRVVARSVSPPPSVSAASALLGHYLGPEDHRALQQLRQLRLAEITQKSCGTLLRVLMQHKWAFPFNLPVDTTRYKDYLSFVRTPCDFSTIKSRLETGAYTTPAEFRRDLDLVFDNARLYNPRGSDCNLMAEALQELADEKWERTVAPKLSEEARLAARQEEEMAARKAALNIAARRGALKGAAAAVLQITEDLETLSQLTMSQAATLACPMTSTEKLQLAADLRSLVADSASRRLLMDFCNRECLGIIHPSSERGDQQRRGSVSSAPATDTASATHAAVAVATSGRKFESPSAAGTRHVATATAKPEDGAEAMTTVDETEFDLSRPAGSPRRPMESETVGAEAEMDRAVNQAPAPAQCSLGAGEAADLLPEAEDETRTPVATLEEGKTYSSQSSLSLLTQGLSLATGKPPPPPIASAGSESLVLNLGPAGFIDLDTCDALVLRQLQCVAYLSASASAADQTTWRGDKPENGTLQGAGPPEVPLVSAGAGTGSRFKMAPPSEEQEGTNSNGPAAGSTLTTRDGGGGDGSGAERGNFFDGTRDSKKPRLEAIVAV